jgi:hypothetical protein
VDGTANEEFIIVKVLSQHLLFLFSRPYDGTANEKFIIVKVLSQHLLFLFSRPYEDIVKAISNLC